jgi:ectoine hydroxylase-related dioxygenase (phytanoyl-CoA dioxygenase family)
MELVASWTALEDIQPGSGELVYYPKSHLFPEFLFGGKYKWIYPKCNELGQYYEHLDSCAQSRNIPKAKFLAKKGDVFIWSADLAHGGGEIEDSNKTRRSIATHYCPISAYPMYRHYDEGSSEIVDCGDGTYYCSQKKIYWTS